MQRINNHYEFFNIPHVYTTQPVIFVVINRVLSHRYFTH